MKRCARIFLLPFNQKITSRSSNILGKFSFNSPYSHALRNIHTTTFLLAKDYYKVLNVPKTATEKEIKKSYFELAKKYHPDTNSDSNATEQFKNVSDAYQVLSDPEKRRNYDTYGTDSGDSPFSSYSSYSAHSGQRTDPVDLFRMFTQGFNASGFGNLHDFPQNSSAFASSKTESKAKVKLTFEEAACGVPNKNITANLNVTCPGCNGTCVKKNSRAVKCLRCNGTGYDSSNTASFFVRFACSACNGSKYVYTDPCTTCNGSGSTNVTKKIKIDVPQAVKNGEVARVSVDGGDLYLEFIVSPSNYFKQDQMDVITECPITISQAILGGVVTIRGLYQNEIVKIPAGSSSHTVIRLNAKGIAYRGKGIKGDHRVVLKIKVPKNLEFKERALVLLLAEMEKREGSANFIANTEDGCRSTDSCNGLVDALREVLHDSNTDSNTNSK